MTRNERLALRVLGGSLALGALGDLVFRGRPLGVNVVLWVLAFVAVLALLIRTGPVRFHQGRRWMAGPLVLFAAAFAWHDSPLLVAVNLIAIAGAVALGALRRTRRDVRRAQVFDYAAGLGSAGFASFAGAVHLLHREVPWDGAARSLRGSRTAAVGRGIAIGLPLVLLFGGLFAAADAVFKGLVADAVPDISHPFVHVVVVGAFAWMSAGLLRDLLAERESSRVAGPAVTALRRARVRLGTTELLVVLGALDLLFLTFVVVQFRYLFGGRGLVQAQAGLTYAEYARHGFFELVAAALLVLPLLLVVNGVARGAPARLRYVRGLSAALVALVLVVMASALERMWIYQQEYGLTELRIYATGVILWLAVVFVWFAATVLRSRPRAFAIGALAAGFAASVAINVMNPDALITRTNLSRPQVDVWYLTTLSDDAVPELLRRLPSLDPPLRRPIAGALLGHGTTADGWQSWNASRSRAASLLREQRPLLQRLAR